MKDDYDLSELEEIKVRGLRYFIMPRYKHHYLTSKYEDFSLDIMLRDLEENSSFVDIGSHYGIYSLMASKKAKKGQVLAIEPVAENYRVLQKNIAANKAKNIKALNYAASDSSGEAEFNIPWASDSAGFYEHPNADTIKKVSVKMAKPDDLINGKKVDFIKIDTEGHELHVLDGLEETLRNNQHMKMLIELNPQCLNNAGATPMDLLIRLKELGKAILIVDEERRELINITDKPERWEELVGVAGYANIYCVPADKFTYTLFISPSAQPGGAELAITDLVFDLKNQGILSHFIVPSEGRITQLLEEVGIGYSVIGFGTWAHKTTLSDTERQASDSWNVKAVQEMSDLTQKLNPHNVFSNTIISPWGSIIASVNHKPHIWMVHEYGNLDHGLVFEYEYNKILEFIDLLSDKVIVNSPNVKEHLTKVINPKKILQIYLRFNQKEIQLRAKLPSKKIYTEKSDLKLVLVGRITESKGQLDAVRAVAELNNTGIKSEIIFVGAVESLKYKKEIDNIITENKLETQVKFVDHVDNPLPIVAQADAALMTSRNEAFGRVTVEAMLLGKPVVGTNSGATKALIKNNGNGLLYEVGDWQGLSKVFETLYKKPSEAKKMGARAKVYAESNFTTDKYVKAVAKLIASLKAGAKTDSPDLLYDKFINETRLTSYRLQEKEKEKNELQQSVERLEREVAEKADTIEKIYNSKSWKTARLLSNGKYKITKVVKRAR